MVRIEICLSGDSGFIMISASRMRVRESGDAETRGGASGFTAQKRAPAEKASPEALFTGENMWRRSSGGQ